VGLFCLALRSCLMIVNVHGSSMHPTLRDGDRVLVFRHMPHGWLRTNQVVVCDFSLDKAAPQLRQSVVIKRLYGLYPHAVRIQKSQYIKALQGYPTLCTKSGYCDLYLPPHTCFLLADGGGADSHAWGAIPV